jgi:hypothetical protein
MAEARDKAGRELAIFGGDANARRLHEQLGKAFDVTGRILDMDITRPMLAKDGTPIVDQDGNERREIDKGLLSIQKDAALSIIGTTVKVDDAALRREQFDKWPELMARVEAAKRGELATDGKLIEGLPRRVR